MSPTHTVLKLGGAMLEQAADRAEVAAHVARLVARGERVVVVHGGGNAIASLHRDLDLPREQRDGLRVTPPKSMELVTMVLAGLVNKQLVAALHAAEVDAIGLSGVDLRLLRAPWLDREGLGRVGGAPEVRPGVLERLLDQGWVPVVAPISLGPDGEPVNVYADTAAQAIAASLPGASLDFASDVEGVRTEDGLAPLLTPTQVEALIAAGVARGGMVPKLRAATASLTAGVQSVRIGTLASLLHERCTVVCASPDLR